MPLCQGCGRSLSARALACCECGTPAEAAGAQSSVDYDESDDYYEGGNLSPSDSDFSEVEFGEDGEMHLVDELLPEDMALADADDRCY